MRPAQGAVGGQIVEHREGLADERFRVGWIGQEPRMAVAYDLAVRLGIRGQHDASRPHRLEQ